ncbi:MAG: hypothetical protein LBC35_06915 [Coriobacteriales bacterium]|jgi:shikimate dehydrogenase|nr:hypothetical protein [Coriobacteriales bacterium]
MDASSTANKTGLIGFPIEHSLSPVMFRAVYEYYELDWHYELYSAADHEAFDRQIAQLQTDDGFIGVNITMPYKKAAAQALLKAGGTLQGDAAVIQAVNLVSVVPGEKDGPRGTKAPALLSGHSVDGAGFVASLIRHRGLDPKDIRVLILGSGSASAAICLALAKAKAADIRIVSRSRLRADEFANLLSNYCAEQGFSTTIAGLSYADTMELSHMLRQAQLVVNATPVGMEPDDSALLSSDDLKPDHTVIDLVYGRGPTALLTSARQAAAAAADGLGTLVEQAALSFGIWADAVSIDPKPQHARVADIMQRAARAELQRRELMAE